MFCHFITQRTVWATKNLHTPTGNLMPRLHSLNCQILNVVGLKAHVQLVSEYLQALSFKMKNHVCNMVFHLEVIVDVISIWCKNSFMPLLQLDYRKSIFKVHIHLANSKCSCLGTKDKVLIRSLQSSENSSSYLKISSGLLRPCFRECTISDHILNVSNPTEDYWGGSEDMYGEEEEWKAVIQMTEVCGDEVRSDRSMWGCCRTCMRTVGQWWGVR